MRRALHVTARTLIEHRSVLVAAAVAALLPLLAPLLPWVQRSSPGDARGAAAFVIAAGLALSVALIYGASCLARDLRERRLSFYFSRPLPAASLWAGKMLAGLLLSAAALTIVALPTVLLEPPKRAGDWPPSVVATVAAVLLAAVALGHALSVMFASRSGWLAVDLTAFVVVATAAGVTMRAIRDTGAADVTTVALWALVGGAAVALLAAGLAQVSQGRTDVRRGHRALSLTLWGVLAGAVTALAAYSVFLTHPTPGSLRSLREIELAPRGSFLVLSGSCAWRGDYRATFLLDAASGTYQRIGTHGGAIGDIAFTADVARAVWLELERASRLPTARVAMSDLRGRRPSTHLTPIVLALPVGPQVAASPSGDLVALQQERLIAVYEVASGRLLASVRLPDGRLVAVDFVGAGRLRIEQMVDHENGPGHDRVAYSLDMAGGTLRETGRLASGHALMTHRRLDLDPPVVIVTGGAGGAAAAAARAAWTSAHVADLRTHRAAEGTSAYWGPRVAFLADGRIAGAEPGASGARLRLYSSDWRPAAVFDLGPFSHVALGAELAPGLVPIVLGTRVSQRAADFSIREECRLLDVSTGAVTPIGAEIRPLASNWWAVYRRAVEPQGTLARLFTTADGSLAAWDPASQRLRTILETGWQ